LSNRSISGSENPTPPSAECDTGRCAARVGDALDDLGDAREEAVVAHALVVERRQHQHAEAAVLPRVPGERDGIRSAQQPFLGGSTFRRDAACNQSFQQIGAFANRQRVGFARRSKDSETARPLGEQPPAVGDEPRRVDGEIGVERRDRRNEDATGKLSRLIGFPSLRRPARAC
jgi:hypothetical protein